MTAEQAPSKVSQEIRIADFAMGELRIITSCPEALFKIADHMKELWPNFKHKIDSNFPNEMHEMLVKKQKAHYGPLKRENIAWRIRTFLRHNGWQLISANKVSNDQVFRPVTQDAVHYTKFCFPAQKDRSTCGQCPLLDGFD